MLNRKSQIGVIEALLLIGILVAAMIFFTTQIDLFSTEKSDTLRKKTFTEIGNYVVSSSVHSESAWIKRGKQSLKMTIPLNENGIGENDIFRIEKIDNTTIKVTEILGGVDYSVNVYISQKFYIGLVGDEPNVDLSENIPSDYINPLNVYMLGEFEFLDFEKALVGGEAREIVYLQISRRTAVIGIKGNMTNRNHDFEGSVKIPDIFEVLAEMGVKYYPIQYRIDPQLLDLYTCLIVPSSLEGLIANLDSDPDKVSLIHDYVNKGGGLIVLSQKYVNSTKPHESTPTPSDSSLRKNVYNFIPTKIIFNYGEKDGVDYNLLELSEGDIISEGIDSKAISGYYPTAAGYIEVPETEYETLKILIREDEVEGKSEGNTGNYPVMVSQRWGSGRVVATTLLLDSRTVVTIEVGENPTMFIKPALITGEFRYQFRDLVDPDHDGVMNYVREDIGGAYVPYVLKERPVLANIDIDNFCVVIVAGEPTGGIAWGHIKQLYRDGGSVFSTGGINGGLLSGPSEIGTKDRTKCTIGVGGYVDPNNVTGTIFYNIDTYAADGDEIPLEWDNLIFCDPDIMLGFDTFWTFNVDPGEPLNSEPGDDNLEQAGIISFNPSSSPSLDAKAKKHNYIKRIDYDENVVPEIAHHGLFYIGEPLESMGGYLIEAYQSKEARPDATIEYPFTVANYGDTEKFFSLSASSSLLWTVEILDADTGETVSSTGFLDPMEDAYNPTKTYYFDGILKLTVPDAASVNGGDVDKTILEVKDGVNLVGKSVLKTTVIKNIEMRPDTLYSYIPPSDTTPQEYTLTVYNWHDMNPDVVDLDVVSSWPYELLEVNGTALTDSDTDGKLDVEVPPNSSYDFILKITPPSSSVGNSSTATVTATSSNSSDSFSSKVVTTCIPSDDNIFSLSANRYVLDSSVESSAEKIGSFYGQQIEDIMTDSVKLIYKTIIGVDLGGKNIFWISLSADNKYIEVDQDDNGLFLPPFVDYDEKGYKLPLPRGGYPTGGKETEEEAYPYFFIDEEDIYIDNLFELMLYVRERKAIHTYILNDIIPDPESTNPPGGTKLELLNMENIKLFRNMLVYTTSQVTSIKESLGPKILLDLNRVIGNNYYRIIGEGNKIKVVALDDASVYAIVDTQGVFIAGQVNTSVSERIYIVITEYGVYIRGE